MSAVGAELPSARSCVWWSDRRLGPFVARGASVLRPRLLVSVLLFSFVTGCAEETGDADCFEWAVAEDIGAVYAVNTCSFERPCDDLEFLCPGTDPAVDCEFSEAKIENPEALTCILDALAQEEEGAYTWSSTAEDDQGWANRSHDIWTRGGSSYYSMEHSVDLSVDSDGVLEVRLRPAADFAACRDAGTDTERLECLTNPWSEVVGVVLSRNNG